MLAVEVRAAANTHVFLHPCVTRTQSPKCERHSKMPQHIEYQSYATPTLAVRGASCLFRCGLEWWRWYQHLACARCSLLNCRRHTALRACPCAKACVAASRAAHLIRSKCLSRPLLGQRMRRGRACFRGSVLFDRPLRQSLIFLDVQVLSLRKPSTTLLLPIRDENATISLNLVLWGPAMCESVCEPRCSFLTNM